MRESSQDNKDKNKEKEARKTSKKKEEATHVSVRLVKGGDTVDFDNLIPCKHFTRLCSSLSLDHLLDKVLKRLSALHGRRREEKAQPVKLGLVENDSAEGRLDVRDDDEIDVLSYLPDDLDDLFAVGRVRHVTPVDREDPITFHQVRLGRRRSLLRVSSPAQHHNRAVGAGWTEWVSTRVCIVFALRVTVRLS